MVGDEDKVERPSWTVSAPPPPAAPTSIPPAEDHVPAVVSLSPQKLGVAPANIPANVTMMPTGTVVHVAPPPPPLRVAIVAVIPDTVAILGFLLWGFFHVTSASVMGSFICYVIIARLKPQALNAGTPVSGVLTVAPKILGDALAQWAASKAPADSPKPKGDTP